LLKKTPCAAIAAVTSILMVGALLTSRPMFASRFDLDRSRSAGSLAPTIGNDLERDAPGDAPPGADLDDQDASDGVDLFGNEVSDAVARYKLDRGGSLYEVHSPRTELPRLSPPSS
jgi:hypothetical protein